MNFDISIVIPCCHHDSQTLDVLKSLELQKNCNFEVLLVMNPPRLNKLKTQLTFKLTQLESQKGANCARNVGLNHAQSDLILFLDSDCLTENPNLLKTYVQHMNNHPELTGCGGPYQIPTYSGLVSQVYQSIQMEWIYSGILDHQFKTQYLLGGNLVIRKSKLKSNRFDEKIIFGGTELEFIQRLVKEKHQFQLLENQNVTHKTKLTYFDLFKKAFKQGQGQFYTKKKLDLIDQKPQNVFINQKRNPYSKQLAYIGFLLFFKFGNQTWFRYTFNHLFTAPLNLYHRVYFYLNLVKRLK